MTDAALAFQLYGTTQIEPAPRLLKAGKLTAQLAGGNLRTIAYDGIEIVRAISYLVRDRDWGTYDPVLSELSIAQTEQSFSISYIAHCDGPEGSVLEIVVSIEGAYDRLTIDAQARSATGFETNRCGFCVLHPIVGLAGTAVSVEHVDGSIEQTELPDLIEPWQPFKDMRAITHTAVPGVSIECRMDGDTFEMEDQRNWSDASYKTYVRPLALPWPYRIPQDETVKQSVTLSIADLRAAARTVEPTVAVDDTVVLSPGKSVGMMPNIGLVITPEEAAATLAAQDVLIDLAVQTLTFHYDPLAGHGRRALADFAAIAALHAGSSTLEIAVPCQQDPRDELQAIASDMQATGFAPEAIVVSPSVDRQSTPPGSVWPECPPLETVYSAARHAFANVRLGGGMLSYFTELNRKRVPAQMLDFITHCTNPIVHAADDLSVMQTLEALPFITRSVRAIYGDKPYRIGPSTIPMRQNPYGSRTMDNPGNGRIPMANTDPRHNGRFGAAFTVGYAASVADAGLECLTLSALTGPFGLIAGSGEPTLNGGMRPLSHVVKTLASLSGQRAQSCVSSDAAKVLAMAASDAAGVTTLLIANITPREQRVGWSGFTPTGPAKAVLAPYAVAVVHGRSG